VNRRADVRTEFTISAPLSHQSVGGSSVRCARSLVENSRRLHVLVAQPTADGGRYTRDERPD
jgi:hypothetical protein